MQQRSGVFSFILLETFLVEIKGPEVGPNEMLTVQRNTHFLIKQTIFDRFDIKINVTKWFEIMKITLFIFLFVHTQWYFLISCNLIGCSSGRLFTISWLWSKSVIFWRMARSEKLLFEDKNYRKIWNFTQWILNNPIWLHVESVPCLKCIFIRAKCSKRKYFLDINIEKQCNFCILYFVFKYFAYIQRYFEKYSLKSTNISTYNSSWDMKSLKVY